MMPSRLLDVGKSSQYGFCPSLGAWFRGAFNPRQCLGDFRVVTTVGQGHQDRHVDKLEHRQIVSTVSKRNGPYLGSPKHAKVADDSAQGQPFIASGREVPETPTTLNSVATLVRHSYERAHFTLGGILKEERLSRFSLPGQGSFLQG